MTVGKTAEKDLNKQLRAARIRYKEPAEQDLFKSDTRKL